MKKIFAFALIAFVLSAVSCKKDKQPGDPGGADKPVAVTGVNILQDEYELEVGDVFDMTAHLTVDGPEGVDQSVVWTSTDSEVAVVENNKILAKKAGTATLKATAVYGNKYAECVVKVYDKPTGVVMLRDGVALSEANPVDFEFSEEVTFEVKVLPATAKQDNWCLEAAD